MKRYQLTIPQELYNEISSIAEKHSVTVVEVMRKYLKLGLLTDKQTIYIKKQDGSFAEILMF